MWQCACVRARPRSILSGTDKGAENKHRKLMFSNTPHIHTTYKCSSQSNWYFIALHFRYICDAPEQPKMWVSEWMRRGSCVAYVLRDINSPFMLCVINKSEIYIDRPMELTTTIQIVCCCCYGCYGSHCADRFANRNSIKMYIRSRKDDVKRQKFLWHVQTFELNRILHK